MISKTRFKLKLDGSAGLNCFCRTPELIENYDKAVVDETQIWACHHRLETHNSDGEKRLVDITKEELQALDMYYDRPASELIFMTPRDHSYMHSDKGKDAYSQKYRRAWRKSYYKVHKAEIDAYKSSYDSRKCFYNGKTLSFGTLRQKFRSLGFQHPNIEATKYLIQKEGDSQ